MVLISSLYIFQFVIINTFNLLQAELVVFSTPGCTMAYLDPFSLNAKPYFKNVSKVVCSEFPPLILSNQTSIWVNKRARLARKLPRKLTCCYRVLQRPNPDEWPPSRPIDDFVDFKGECKVFTKSAHIYDEFVEVTCRNGEHDVYKDYHAFTVTDRRVFIPARRTKFEKPSVLIIAVDSVSRQNLVRQMPKTVKYLRYLGAQELYGLSKIGEDKFSNMIGFLTGISYKNLKKTCLAKEKIFVDECPFMWKAFHQKGYITVFSEDNTFSGLFFNKNSGFRGQPTDVYTQPFMYMNEDERGIGQLMNGKRICSGARTTSKVLNDYLAKFVLNMTDENRPFWGLFFSGSLTSSDFNIAPTADNIYKSLFVIFNRSKVMEKTVIIFMSDQGSRIGDFRNTNQGYLEERQPFAYILLPQWIKVHKKIALRNLMNNRHRLTTLYDLGATIMHFLRHDLNKYYYYNKGISLFSEITDRRTCESANIPENYCTCHKSITIDTKNRTVRFVALATIQAINLILANNSDCRKLKLNQIISARYIKNDSNSDVHYVINVATQPGNGVFESTATLDVAKIKVTIIGDISRTSLNTNNHCVKEKELKLYCDCKSPKG